MRAPRLKADYETGEGDVIFPEGWDDLGVLLRADILQDWMEILTDAYNDAVDGMNRKPGAVLRFPRQ